MNSYLLFHSVAELFSIVVAWGILTVTWNSRRYIQHGYFMFLGLAFAAVGTLDLLHTLTYKGMGVFPGVSPNIPTQLWIASRYLHSIALLLAPVFLTRPLRLGRMATLFSAVTAGLLWSVASGWFPDCFREGAGGLTAFKITSEYLICAITAGAIVLLWRHRARFEKTVLRLLLASMAVTIATELAFTLYVDSYGLANMVGHLLKFVASLLVYRAIIVTGIKRPFESLFRDLVQSNDELQKSRAEALDLLREANAARQQAERTSEKLQEEIAERLRVEKALRHSEQLYKTMGEAVPYGVWMCNPHGGVEYASQSFLDLCEQTMEEHREFGWTHRLPPDEVEPMVKKWLHCCATGEDWDSEHHVLGPDGQYHPVLTRGKPVRDEQGNITGWVGINLDITERKKIEQALFQANEQLDQNEKHLRRVLDSVVAFMGVVTPDGVLSYINRVTLDISGLRWDEVVGRPIYDTPWWSHSPEVRESIRQAVERARNGESLRFDTTALVANGRLIDIDFAITPMRDEQGNITHLIPSAVDITERKQADEALRAANRQLCDTDRRKDEFLAMLAHELRNPLAPVRNSVQILKMVSPGDPTLQRQQAIIERQVSHMARLLDDLLDISRVARGKITLRRQTLHVGDVLLHALETTRPLIESRGHDLEFIPPPAGLRVEGDIDRLAQVVGNLLTNSAKYTEEGGRIRLSAWEREGQAIIEVRDNGMGIAPEMLPRVFDIFTQAERSLDRSQGGLGIGLSMVKRLSELHGGSVDVCSEGLGKGAIFVVRLPAMAESILRAADDGSEEHAASAANGARSSRAALRVLVVDDLADSAQTLGELLELWGHDVRTAFDGPAALAIAREFHPQVALLDIGMPGMDGYETARRLRLEHDANRMMLVAMTGYGQEEDRQRASQAGFIRHLTKPVDLAALAALLDQVRSDYHALPTSMD